MFNVSAFYQLFVSRVEADFRMNMQQAVPPRSVNGIGRRRGEKEPGNRFDNKLSTGKINSGRLTASGKGKYIKKLGNCIILEVLTVSQTRCIG